MAPTFAKHDPRRRMTLYAELGRPAIARFDVDVMPNEELPVALRWNSRLFLQHSPGSETYIEAWPVEVGIPEKPADPEPRRVLILDKTPMPTV